MNNLHVANGVRGAFVCDTTGEGMSLTMTERQQIGTYLNQGSGVPWGTMDNFPDVLGNQYQFNVVGTNQVSISTSTKSALAGVGIDWGVY